MTTKIPREVETALSAFRSVARRLNMEGVTPPMHFDDLTAVQQFIQQARHQLVVAKNKSKTQIEEIQEILSKKSDDSNRIWQDVDKACAKVEDLLRNPPTLKIRLDEGRRSLTANVNKSLHNMLIAEVKEEGSGDGFIVAEITDKSLKGIEAHLPNWALAWCEYSFDWIHSDINRQIEYLWTPRERDLPCNPPKLPKFTLPDVRRISSTFHVSDLRTEKPKTGVLGGMYRHFRTILYGVMSIGFMFGFSKSSGETEGFGLYSVVMILATLVAVSYGYFQSIADKETEKEKLRADVLKQAERMLAETVRYWFDRAGDKMTEYLRESCDQQRQLFVVWYRQTILPAKERMEQEKKEQLENIKKAQAEHRPLERKVSDLEQALVSLKKVKKEIEGIS